MGCTSPHAASETGAQAACILYSFIATCKIQDINPAEYLADILDRIQDHSQLKLSKLLPHNWKAKKYPSPDINLDPETKLESSSNNSDIRNLAG